MQKLLTILTLAAGCLFADCGKACCDPCGFDNCACDPCNTCNTCDTCCCSPCACEPCDFVAPCPPDTMAYNAPVVIDIKCGWDMFLSASFLYMQAKEENLQYIESFSYVPNATADYDTTASYGTISFDYEPAFKVGVGFNLGCDDWMFNVEYLRYHADVGSGSFSQTSSSEADTGTYGIFYWSTVRDGGIHADEFDLDQGITVTANANWRLEMDIVDFDVSRKYYVGKCLTFEPNFGIRAAWIDQKYTANYTVNATEQYNSTNKSESWAVGLKTGLDTNWRFCSGFYMFGNSAMSILYTDYNGISSSQSYTDGSFITNLNAPSRSLCFLRPHFNLGIGLGWADYFCCNDWFFDLRIGYETHVFWGQNVLPGSYDAAQDPSQLNGDLYLHGLIITARLDF